MAKLISNKVKKVSSDQVDPNRYEFLSLEHAEPDLGVPAGNGYFLVSNTDGSREWTLTIDATTLEGNTASDLQNFAIQQANDAYSNSISYINSEISSLVNTAPGVLDTLNELAEAINDDPDFANSVASQISTAYSNAIAYVDSQTTDAFEEGNTNLYFTENRVVDAVENNTVNTVSVESSFILPVGNNDSRPSPPITGMMRFNTELNDFEGYNGIEWVSFGSSFSFENDVDLQEESGTTDLQEESGTDDLS